MGVCVCVCVIIIIMALYDLNGHHAMYTFRGLQSHKLQAKANITRQGREGEEEGREGPYTSCSDDIL